MAPYVTILAASWSVKHIWGPSWRQNSQVDGSSIVATNPPPLRDLCWYSGAYRLSGDFLFGHVLRLIWFIRDSIHVRVHFLNVKTRVTLIPKNIYDLAAFNFLYPTCKSTKLTTIE